jgi:hypothetical protein
MTTETDGGEDEDAFEGDLTHEEQTAIETEND